MSPRAFPLTVNVSLGEIEPVRDLVTTARRWRDARERRRATDAGLNKDAGIFACDFAGMLADGAAHEARAAAELEIAVDRFMTAVDERATSTAVANDEAVETDPVRAALSDAVAVCSSARLSHIGMSQVRTPQVSVEAIERWKAALA